MKKGRVAEAMWHAGSDAAPQNEAPLRAGGQSSSRKFAEYLRMVPVHELASSKTATWINEGRSAAQAGFSGYTQAEYNTSRGWGANSNPPPVYNSLHADAASRDQPSIPAAPPETIYPETIYSETIYHEPDTIIRPWSGLLEKALESEVFPRLLEAQRAGGIKAERPASRGGPTHEEIDEFVGCILTEDITKARALAQSILRRGIGRTALLDDLFAPAARRFGVLWEQDSCDFAAVTLGILRLDQMMHETERDNAECHGQYGHDRRALLTPVPGDQHSFGIGVVADAFRGGGWHVWSGKATSRPELLRLVRRESFDIIGFSSTNQRLVGQLPSCVRAVRRASRNRNIRVMVGGKYFLDHPDQVIAVGADAMAVDARDALKQANGLISSLAGVNGHATTQT